MGSILNDVKKPLGLEADYTAFDADITMFINAAISTLTQIGIGPSTGFSIKDSTADWPDFLGDATDLEEVKTYIFLRVRLLFDPPTTAAVLESYKEEIRQHEWRLSVKADASAIVVV